MTSKHTVLYSIFLFAVLTISYIVFSPSPPPISPQSNLAPITYSVPPKPYVILGFAPYWNLKKISPLALESITHFAYFHLLLNGDGTLYTRANRREEDPGFTNYKRLISHAINIGNKPLILTFMPESQAALAESINSSESRRATSRTIANTLMESHASGINIDYEPLGDIDPMIRTNFTLFIQELRTQLPNTLISISVYASAANKPRIWDLQGLGKSTDYFVVMTYDYTMPITDKAGPGAPMRGAGQLFDNDIVKNIAEVTKLVPAEKILLGIPFYGYEWNTVDESKYADTLGRGSVASLERIQEMINDHSLELLWDTATMTPYGIIRENGKTSQIYFENEMSINLKLNLVKNAHLGGIAIWALGYEGDNPTLWHTLKNSLSP